MRRYLRMDQPLVSVVIPAYNCSKTIQRCLDSVLSQNHSALQVVAVSYTHLLLSL